MRCTLNIPCLWQFGFIPRFDGYACQVTLPVLIFLAICGLISLSLTRQTVTRDELSAGYTDAMSISKKQVAGIFSSPSVDVTSAPDSRLHYGVVIDCGSSGSRVYVYCWPPHSGGNAELLRIQPVRDHNRQPVIRKIEPGISTYADKPSEAAEYLRPLLDHAAAAVPKDKHQETPLYVYSTAGMRMLSDRDQQSILSDLRTDIPLWYNFLFSETHSEVISGKQEAIYAWIAINHALGRFDHTGGVSASEQLSLVDLPGPEPLTHVRKQTVGVLDMGGASLQVAYEVPHSEDVAKGLVTEFSLGCTKSDVEHVYRLYVATFLSYGSNSARKTYEQTLFTNTSATTPGTVANTTHTGSTVVSDPCLPVKFREQISTVTPEGEPTMLTLEGSGNFHECKLRLRPLLNQSAPCMKEPCSINGIFQPEIDFDHSNFYGFSEFFYTMEDLLKIGGSYNSRQFTSMAREFCNREWSQLEEWQKKKLYPRADQNRYRLQCFKSAWLSAVLHEGLGFPSQYKHLTSAQYIEGEEIHWSRGALLYKTKYYPLRTIETDRRETHNYHPPWQAVYRSNHLLLFCVLVVAVAIGVYSRGLRGARSSGIRRVPTMSFYMTDEGQVFDGMMSLDGLSSSSTTSSGASSAAVTPTSQEKYLSQYS